MASLFGSVSLGFNARPLVVFFEDEARFGRISREMYCWVKKEVVPSVCKQTIREYIYAYSALSPQTGDCFSIITPCCNTEAMNYFLTELTHHYIHYRILLILDKAGWHVSKQLKQIENLQLMYLPPYSPELNPVELLWRETRKKYFHNRIFNSLDEVENTLSEALLQYHLNPMAIKKLSMGFI